MYSNITIEKLLYNVRQYIKDENEIKMIYSAYLWAKELHEKYGQMRQSGEPYITHPLSVAFILSELKADANTMVAALLHDTIEDTGITREDIEKKFECFGLFEYRGNMISRGSYIASLVYGVTNIKDENISSKEEQNAADIRKILSCTDIRVILIKLADRLHNMRTSEFMSIEKQIKKSIETLNFYVPLAHSIGLYRIKNELEDLCLRILEPELYFDLERRVCELENLVSPVINRMNFELDQRLLYYKIPHRRIEEKRKHICGALKNIENGEKLEGMYDLWAIKLIVNGIDEEKNIANCYRAKDVVHEIYESIKQRDFISNPKSNMYQSIHTTVRVEDYLIQCQIRTELMDLVASLGLAAYWQDNNIDMNDELRKLEFFKRLQEVNKLPISNIEYVHGLTEKVFCGTAYSKIVRLDRRNII